MGRTGWRARWVVLGLLGLGGGLGCGLGSGRVPALPTVDPAPAATPAPPGPSVAEDEAGLEKEARLDALGRLAVARSPAVLEAKARASAAIARVRASGRFPDLSVQYQIFGQPLARPWALGEAQMHMFGVRLTLPPAGSLDAATKIAVEEAKVAIATLRARELDAVADVHKAWAQYWGARHERTAHVAHMDASHKLLELAKVLVVAGKASAGDALRFELEASRIHGDLLVLEQQEVTSRARLNALVGRPVDAPLGPPPSPADKGGAPRLEDVRAIVLGKRPELLAAQANVDKSKAAVAAVEAEARWPMVMLGLDYQLMPMATSPHAFGGMVQISLPWLSSRRADEVKAAEAAVEADKATVKALEAAILLQVKEALARYDAQRATLTLLDGKLLPQAEKSSAAMLASYGAGGGDALSVLDALRTLQQMRVERSRTAAQVEIAYADVERALGVPLASLPKQPAKKETP